LILPTPATLCAVREKLQLPEVLFPVSTPPTREELLRLVVEAMVQSQPASVTNPFRDPSGFTALATAFPPCTPSDLSALIRSANKTVNIEDIAHEAAMRRRGAPARTVETITRVEDAQEVVPVPASGSKGLGNGLSNEYIDEGTRAMELARKAWGWSAQEAAALLYTQAQAESTRTAWDSKRIAFTNNLWRHLAEGAVRLLMEDRALSFRKPASDGKCGVGLVKLGEMFRGMPVGRLDHCLRYNRPGGFEVNRDIVDCLRLEADRRVAVQKGLEPDGPSLFDQLQKPANSAMERTRRKRQAAGEDSDSDEDEVVVVEEIKASAPVSEKPTSNLAISIKKKAPTIPALPPPTTTNTAAVSAADDGSADSAILAWMLEHSHMDMGELSTWEEMASELQTATTHKGRDLLLRYITHITKEWPIERIRKAAGTN
jgi:hypothetical protein